MKLFSRSPFANSLLSLFGSVPRSIGLLLTLLAPFVGLHGQQTATVLATAKSFQLLPANPLFVSGLGNIYTYFSTFNGTTGAFLIDANGNFVSGEVRPRLNAPGVYEGAYGQTTLLQNYDYGSFALTVPLTDGDGDGVLDFLQVSKATNISTSGSGYSMGVAAPFSITIAMSRSANNATGTYTATTQISGSGANTVAGSFVINGFSGNLTYTRGASNSMALTLTSLATGKSNSGSTAYTISNGGDSLNYGAFNITDMDGIVYHVTAGSLSRSGSKYRGTMSLTDGMPQTYWVDFRDFWVSITDSQDTNGNGIPDLTDALPVIVAPSNAVITITVQ